MCIGTGLAESLLAGYAPPARPVPSPRHRSTASAPARRRRRSPHPSVAPPSMPSSLTPSRPDPDPPIDAQVRRQSRQEGAAPGPRGRLRRRVGRPARVTRRRRLDPTHRGGRTTRGAHRRPRPARSKRGPVPRTRRTRPERGVRLVVHDMPRPSRRGDVAGQPAEILAGPRRAQAVLRSRSFHRRARRLRGAQVLRVQGGQSDVDAVGRARAPGAGVARGGVQGPAHDPGGEAIADASSQERRVAHIGERGRRIGRRQRGPRRRERGDRRAGKRVGGFRGRKSAPGDGRWGWRGRRRRVPGPERALSRVPLRSPPPLPTPRRGGPVRARAQRRRLRRRGCGVSRAWQVRRVVGKVRARRRRGAYPRVRIRRVSAGVLSSRRGGWGDVRVETAGAFVRAGWGDGGCRGCRGCRLRRREIR